MEIVAYIVGACIGLILCIPMFLVYGAGYVMEAIAFTKFSKIKPAKCLWLIWIPCHVEYVGKKHIMLQMTDEAEFRLFGGKLTLKNKMTSFWIYLAIYAVLCVTMITTMLLCWIPFVGFLFLGIQLMLTIPGTAVISFFEFVYLRDLLNTFDPNNENNVTTAVWVTIANLFTMGLARAIILLRLANQLEAVEE